MSADNDHVVVPNFGDVRCYGVEPQPQLIIVEIDAGAERWRFILPAERLKELACKLYAHAKRDLGELDPSAPGTGGVH